MVAVKCVSFVTNGRKSSQYIPPGPVALDYYLNPTSTNGTISPEEGKIAQCAVMNKAQTSALCEGMSTVLCQHSDGDKQKILISQMEEQFHSYLDSASTERLWCKRAKYLLSYPLALFLGNELPPAPDCAFSPTGFLRRWMRQRLISRNQKNVHLWYSWLQVKRSALPLSEDYVDGCYQDHFDLLSKPETDGHLFKTTSGFISDTEARDRTIAAIFKNPVFSTLLDSIAENLFEDSESFMDLENAFQEHNPKGSACFTHTRSQGGQYEALLAMTSYTIGFSRLELSSMTDFPVVYGKYGVHYNRVIETFEPSGSEEWLDLLDRIPSSGVHSATIQAVLEPLKCRVISKGPALEYYRMKPLQKKLHTLLRHMPAFRLIGQEFCGTMLIDLVNNTFAKDNDGIGSYIDRDSAKWLSVDYSAATDNLSWVYSSQILRRILSRLPDSYMEEALSVLGPHDLHYPTTKVVEKSPGCYTLGRTIQMKGRQVRGQLMGSILSFPILCLANLGLYLAVTNRTDKRSLDSVLINGDDMLYIGDQKLFNKHTLWGGFIGLEMSVGKAYHSSWYANVNSTSVCYSLNREDSNPVTVPYFPSGLFLDRHKVQENKDDNVKKEKKNKNKNENIEEVELVDDDEVNISINKNLNSFIRRTLPNLHYPDYFGSVITNINLILSGTLYRKRPKVLGDYLQLHKDKINAERLCPIILRGKRVLYLRNLFTPISLGGYGVKCPIGFNKYTEKGRNSTPLDRIFAGAQLRSSSCPFSPHPLCGVPVDKHLPFKVRPWLKTDELLSIDYHTIIDKDHFFSCPKRLMDGPELVRCMPLFPHKDYQEFEDSQSRPFGSAFLMDVVHPRSVRY